MPIRLEDKTASPGHAVPLTMGRDGVEPLELTSNDVANFLGVSPEVVRRLARDKEIRATRIGGQWRFARSAVVQLLASQLEK